MIFRIKSIWSKNIKVFSIEPKGNKEDSSKGGIPMSQMHYSTDSILAMLEGKYSKEDIKQALADLEAMKENISEYTYKNIKALLEAKL